MHNAKLEKALKENFSYTMSESELSENMPIILSPLSIEKHEKINNLLNIVFCVFMLFICDFKVFENWNIVKMGIAFIIFDMLLLIANTYFINILPYRQILKFEDIMEHQKYVEFLEKKVAKLEKEKKEFANKYCFNCSSRYWSDRFQEYSCKKSLKNQCIIYQEYDWYFKELEYHKSILVDELEKVKTEKVLENSKVSSDYSDKLSYFKDMHAKFEHLSKNIDVLTPIVVSLYKLIQLLETKPIGLTFVSNMIYIYLDELQTISTKLVNLDVEQKERYIDKLLKISKALSANIDDISVRIDTYETEDIEIGLNVLFAELVKDTEDNNNV